MHNIYVVRWDSVEIMGCSTQSIWRNIQINTRTCYKYTHITPPPRQNNQSLPANTHLPPVPPHTLMYPQETQSMVLASGMVLYCSCISCSCSIAVTPGCPQQKPCLNRQNQGFLSSTTNSHVSISSILVCQPLWWFFAESQMTDQR